MNKIELSQDHIRILNNIEKCSTQRLLAFKCGFSLGKTNKLLNDLKNLNYIRDNKLNKNNLYGLKVNSAIILAAGPGLRMLPINNCVPKALLKINNEPIIERTIKQLQEKNIKDIYVVVGYKKENFEYLIDKYGINLLINSQYFEDNNLLSLFKAHKYINNSYIIPGDLYFKENIFNEYENESYYLLANKIMENGYYTIDQKGYLKIGKNKFYKCVGVSYISSKDSETLVKSLSLLSNNNQKLYWEQVLFLNKNYHIKVKLVEDNVYSEINTFEDLIRLDSHSDVLDNEHIKTICDVFGVGLDDVKNVVISKKGMTNRSFIFEIKDKKYIMRVPGEGTDKLINRKQEYDVYQIVSSLGISDKVIFMDPSSGVKITEFIPNSHNCDLNSWDEIAQAMKRLKEFHQLKLSVDFIFDVFEQINYYEKLRGQTSLYSDYDEVKKNIFALKPFIEKNRLPYQLCHIDSVPDNFLFSKEDIRLIDWEYASNQDPHIDIAMFAIYAGFNKNEIDRLIDIYFDGKVNNLIRMKIYSYVAISGFLWSNWCEYKYTLGVEFGEYSISQYRYGKEYSKIVLEYLKNEC